MQSQAYFLNNCFGVAGVGGGGWWGESVMTGALPGKKLTNKVEAHTVVEK